MGVICAISLFGWSMLAARAGTVQSLGLRGYCQLCEQITGDGWCHFHVSTANCAMSVNKGGIQFHRQALSVEEQRSNGSGSFDCVRGFKTNIRDELLQISGCAKLKDNQFYYNGTVSITRTGLPCQRWDSQSPHQHEYREDSDVATGENLSQINNYCREMYDDPAKMPWCYTTSEKIKWQFCSIEVCPSDDLSPIDDCYEVRDKDGEDYIFYNGTRDTTVSGWTCQRWDEQEPQGHGYGVEIDDFLTGETEMWEVANYCRATNEDSSTLLPWCYTINPDVRWEVCVITACPPSQ